MAEPGWEKAKDLLDKAQALSGREREEFLDRECGGGQLRSFVESLLGGGRSPSPDVGGVSNGTTTYAPLTEKAGSRIGPYKLLQQIGEGGFGVVFMAEQMEPVRRRVALKIIKLGMDTRRVVARFEAERQALAMMDHPNIAKVFDAGATESGRPYFVMELVRGVPITEYCDANNLSAAERLDLFMPVCRAIQHAHIKGVIHRDIKPSNILVTLHDGKPVPKVIDFGIAKATDHHLTEKTLFTELRQLIGTPAYMSPEQAEMSGLDIDTRTDVYSLGVLLYELLTGSTPFAAEDLLKAGYGEMQRIIRETEPPRPSTRVSTLGDSLASVAARRRTEPRRLGLLLRGDIDWIVMKALEKDRTRRYETAEAFAADVQRHLSGEPVVAAPPSAAYRMRKFVRKHRGQVVGASVVVAALLMGLIAVWIARQETAKERDNAKNNAIKERHERERADNFLEDARVGLEEVVHQNGGKVHREVGTGVLKDGSRTTLYNTKILDSNNVLLLDRTVQANGEISILVDAVDLIFSRNNELRYELEEQRDAAEKARKEAEQQRDAATRAKHTADAERDRAEVTAYRGNIVAAKLALDNNDSVSCRDRLDKCPARLRNWEWRYLDTLLNDAEVVLRGHKGQVRSAMFSPDGSKVLSVGDPMYNDRTARMWDSADGHQLFAIESAHARFFSAAFAPNGSKFITFATPSMYEPNEDFPSILQIWDSTTGHEIRRIVLPVDKPDSIVFGEARAALSPDGTRILWCSSAHSRPAIIELDAPEHEFRFDSPGLFMGDAPFSPDGTLVCTISGDEHSAAESASVWEVATGAKRFETPMNASDDQAGQIFFTRFSPDSRLLATNKWSGNTLTWDALSGKSCAAPPTFGDDIGGASSWRRDTLKFPFCFGPSGQIAAGLLKDEQGIRLWEVVTGRESWQSRHATRIEFVCFGPKGDILASSDENDTTRIFDVKTGACVAALAGQTINGRDLGGPHSPFNCDGDRLVTKASNGDICIWSLPITLGRTELASSGKPIDWSLFVPKSSTIVGSQRDGAMHIYDAWTGNPIKTVGNDPKIDSGSISRDGRMSITLGRDGHFVTAWDLEHGTRVASHDFGKELRASEHRVNVWTARFLGRHILVPRAYYTSANENNDAPSRADIILWDPYEPDTILPFGQFADCYRGISVSPKEDRIVLGSEKDERFLIDAHSARIVSVLDKWQSNGWASPGAFSSDGLLIAGVVPSRNEEQSIRIWRSSDGIPLAKADFHSTLGLIQSLKFSPDGSHVALVTWSGKGTVDGRVVLVRANDGQIVWSVPNPGKSMDNLDFSPDGTRLVTSQRLYQVGMDFWDTADGANVFSLPYRLGDPFAIDQKDWRTFSDDGVLVYVADSAGQPVVLRARPRRKSGDMRQNASLTERKSSEGSRATTQPSQIEISPFPSKGLPKDRSVELGVPSLWSGKRTMETSSRASNCQIRIDGRDGDVYRIVYTEHHASIRITMYFKVVNRKMILVDWKNNSVADYSIEGLGAEGSTDGQGMQIGYRWTESIDRPGRRSRSRVNASVSGSIDVTRDR